MSIRVSQRLSKRERKDLASAIVNSWSASRKAKERNLKRSRRAKEALNAQLTPEQKVSIALSTESLNQQSSNGTPSRFGRDALRDSKRLEYHKEILEEQKKEEKALEAFRMFMLTHMSNNIHQNDTIQHKQVVSRVTEYPDGRKVTETCETTTLTDKSYAITKQ